MKICYIAAIDRVVKYFFGPQIDAISKENNEVTCITNFSDLEFKKELDKKIKTESIVISRNVNPLNLIKCIRKLTKIFKKEKYDVIQFTGPSTGLICALAGKRAKIKSRVYCLWGVRYEGFNGIKRKIFKFLEKTTCKHSTNIIFDSEYNNNFLVKEQVISVEKGYVVSKGSACGIDLNVYDVKQKELYNSEIRIKYNIPQGAFVFGYLGRISYEKGINELFCAMKQIMDKDENVYLLMVGFIEEEKGLDIDLLNWARFEKRVVFTGRQDKPEKFYATFNLFIFPSYREGFGGGVIQAGAFAVPSIVSNIGPLLETIKTDELGCSFCVKDSQSLLQKIMDIYKNQQMLDKCGFSMLEYVHQFFDREQWMQQYVQFIRNVHDKE